MPGRRGEVLTSRTAASSQVIFSLGLLPGERFTSLILVADRAEDEFGRTSLCQLYITIVRERRITKVTSNTTSQ